MYLMTLRYVTLRSDLYFFFCCADGVCLILSYAPKLDPRLLMPVRMRRLLTVYRKQQHFDGSRVVLVHAFLLIVLVAFLLIVFPVGAQYGVHTVATGDVLRSAYAVDCQLQVRNGRQIESRNVRRRR